jgi:hypothetical protein
MMSQLVIALAMWLGAGCNGAQRTSAPSPSPQAAPSPSASPSGPAAGAVAPGFARAAASASLVFEGEVVAAGPTPGGWSGRFAAYQAVTYRVTRIAADRDRRLSVGAELTVHHLLVAGSATADTRPQLRPALTRAGAAVIVLARWTGDRWTGVDEHHGLVIADAAHRAALPGP